MKHEAIINCGTEGCSRFGETINVMLWESVDVNALSEDFGHGSESEACTCPKCGELGYLADVLEGQNELLGDVIHHK